MAKIIFNNKFYTEAIINKALEDYSEFLSGTIINNEFELELSRKQNIENLEEEFANYVLGLMKNGLHDKQI